MLFLLGFLGVSSERKMTKLEEVSSEDDSLKEDSLGKRYFSKLGGNLLGAPMTLAVHAIAPRLLGVQGYGDFSFLSAFFTSLSGFFDTGSSEALYVKLSQRPEEKKLLRFYWELWFGLATILLLGVLSLAASPFAVRIWPGQESLVILLAAVWSVLTWFAQTLSRVVDAYALTVAGELVRLVQRFFTLILFALCLYFLGTIALESFLLLQCLSVLLLIFLSWYVIGSTGRATFPGAASVSGERGGLASEFFDYVHPMIVYSAVGLLSGVADRWMLQSFSGSEQQGYFGVAFQISAACFLFTAAMRPLLTREFAKAGATKDRETQAALFRRYLPLLFFVAAYFGVFVVLHADILAVLIGGEEFVAASMVVMLMGFYPIHQTYGQLSGALFFANSETRIYRNIGCTTMLIGLPVSYFLLAPTSTGGFELGAPGLAAKMIVLQFATVNIGLWVNTRRLELSFVRFFLHQLAVIVLLLILAGVSRLLIGEVVVNSMLLFLCSGVFYTLMVFALAWLQPQTLGLSREDAGELLKKIRARGFSADAE